MSDPTDVPREPPAAPAPTTQRARPYQVDMEAAMLLAQLTEPIDTDRLVAAIDSANAVGPLFSPGSFMHAQDRLAHQRRIFVAIGQLRAAWVAARPVFEQKVAPEILDLARAEAAAFDQRAAARAEG